MFKDIKFRIFCAKSTENFKFYICLYLFFYHFSFFQIQLLTGVGRFNEMTYIFDALKQHHQFELLLRKGMEKV